MPLKTLLINSIFRGLSSSQNFVQDGQYLAGIGFDPEAPMSDSVGDRLSSGAIRPTAFSKFSSTNVTSAPIAIITNPKNTNIYVVLNNGRLISYDSAFGTETLVGTVSGNLATGAKYYNNYIYITTGTDVSRYGPLSSSPTLVDGVWTGATLGSKTALVNNTFPSMRGSVALPAHWMHAHVDNKLYLLDFKDGKGLVHYIKTTKTTHEGDTNDASAYQALDLPIGYMPTCAASFGNFLAVGAIQTTNGTLVQGKAAVFFWDTVADSFYAVAELPDALVTALLNVNGSLYAFSGQISNGADSSNGYRVSQYVGGTTFKTIRFSATGQPPFPGAVSAIGDRLVYGTFTQISTTTPGTPEYFAVAMAIGSKDPAIPGGIHAIAKATCTNSSSEGIITALGTIQQASFANPKLVLGWKDGSGSGLDNASTTYGTTVFRSQMFNVGRKFAIRRIRIPLGAAVAANMTITPKVFLDDFSSSDTTGLTVINNTNYAASQRHVVYETSITGNHNFCLELRHSGTALLPVLTPISVDIELMDD